MRDYFNGAAARALPEFGRKDAGQSSELGSETATALREIKGLADGLAERDKEINAFAEKAAAEIKDHGKMLADTKAALDLLVKDGVETQARIKELEQKLIRKAGNDNGPGQTLGEMFTETDDFKTLAKSKRGIARMPIKTIANITSLTTGTGGVGDAIRPDRLQGVMQPALRRMTIRNLLMPGRTASNAIEYVKETGFQNMAAMVAEGGAKAQSDIAFDLVTTNVRTLAHWVKASKQVLDDIPLLQSYIDGRLRYGLEYVEETQLLSGDGTGQNLSGLITQATAYDTGLSSVDDTYIDEIRHAILQVRVAEYRASGIVMHPADWEKIELTKDGNGNYVWANPAVNNGQNLWGLPVVDTTAISEGHFLVGAFDMAAQVFDREDANVEVSTEDADNFTKNMVTIRAEERLALAVYRPESLIYGAFA